MARIEFDRDEMEIERAIIKKCYEGNLEIQNGDLLLAIKSTISNLWEDEFQEKLREEYHEYCKFKIYI